MDDSPLPQLLIHSPSPRHVIGFVIVYTCAHLLKNLKASVFTVVVVNLIEENYIVYVVWLCWNKRLIVCSWKYLVLTILQSRCCPQLSWFTTKVNIRMYGVEAKVKLQPYDISEVSFKWNSWFLRGLRANLIPIPYEPNAKAKFIYKISILV